MRLKFLVFLVASLALLSQSAFALVEGAISGSVTDSSGVAVSGAQVDLQTLQGQQIKRAATDVTGNYQFFPVDFGDYKVVINANGYAPYTAQVHVASGGTAEADAQLLAQGAAPSKEMVLNVTAKRHVIRSSSTSSAKEITNKEIEQLPQGEDITLPKLIATTTPGVVPGPFGQMFIRGNHANIQYQIDGVQLPDSPSNTFGQAFTPRNIDHMEVITGGIPAEYGERLAAVMNIITKTGPETPGGTAELNYGSYDTFEPWATFGGSNSTGDFHYFGSAQYTTTSRGLDTPQPRSVDDVKSGGTEANHDSSNGNNEFLKLDWLPNNVDKLSVIAFNSYDYYEIPTFTDDINKESSIFTGTDPFGNTWSWTPPTTNDTQAEDNAYVELVWKHTFTDRSFLQVSPYYKYSLVHVTNDLTNDLDAANTTSFGAAIPGAVASSFAENRHVNNFGGKADYTDRFNDRNLFKAGTQVQESRASGSVDVWEQTQGNAVTSSADDSPTNGYFESLYAQDTYTIFKPLVLNAGLRFDATQFHFADINTADNAIQPRVGLSYMATPTTKLHVFYGRLFQPAPVENLRDTFAATGAGQLTPYDIKAEKDNYFEFGVDQQVQNQLVSLTSYYKLATDMLDDAQLLNTSIAQPYNFAHGYAYGIELSVNGKINDDWSDYANYSYEIAKGQGISGGLFAFQPGQQPSNDYQFLDHVQIHTANAGVTYAKDYVWWSTQGLFGSGLRTGADNSESLPAHFTMDTSVGYQFHGDTWLTKFKVSADMLNIFNNAYPITIANGFNGSHYAAGREFFVHLTKDL